MGDGALRREEEEPRRRLRELGLAVGRFPTGQWNAITDVPGVLVGHRTVIHEDGPARTGVTAILPNAGNIFMERVFGGSFILNGAGEMSGIIQVEEWGLIETPILLTNTLAVGQASQACVDWMVTRYPGIGGEHDVIIPLVGECDDSYLNDIAGGHLTAEHVHEAIEGAASGPVREGNVGGGTGMVAFDLKGGIGTSSRVVFEGDDAITLGALVMSNVGRLEDLRVDGVPVGEHLAGWMGDLERRRTLYGSIIVVIATDAPLTPQQLGRLCRRGALALGRVGSYAAHGSGEILLGFSTANLVPRRGGARIIRVDMLSDGLMDELYRAVIECVEEAMLNALCMAEPMVGIRGRYVPALPLERMAGIVSRHRPPQAG